MPSVGRIDGAIPSALDANTGIDPIGGVIQREHPHRVGDARDVITSKDSVLAVNGAITCALVLGIEGGECSIK